MRSIASPVGRITAKAFEKKYITLGRIISEWRAIVGEDVALRAQPAGLLYRRTRPGEKPAVTLQVAASDSDALALQYRKGLLIEKINALFGESAVADIRFVSRPAPATFRRRPRARRTPSIAEKNHLSQILANGHDAELTQGLAALGEALIANTERNG